MKGLLSRVREAVAERGEYRVGRLAVSPWRWSARVVRFGDEGGGGHYSLNLGCLWVTLGKSANGCDGDGGLSAWGVHWMHHTLVLSWGDRRKHVYMPWMMDHCRVEVGLWGWEFTPYERYGEAYLATMEAAPEPAGMYREVLPYQYRLRSGEVQVRAATVTVERRTWCWRGWPFRAVRWPSKSVTTIEVEFSGEVGERTGSWKGGVVGCGYEMSKGETPRECLRRMELERKFD